MSVRKRMSTFDNRPKSEPAANTDCMRHRNTLLFKIFLCPIQLIFSAFYLVYVVSHFLFLSFFYRQHLVISNKGVRKKLACPLSPKCVFFELRTEACINGKYFKKLQLIWLLKKTGWPWILPGTLGYQLKTQEWHGIGEERYMNNSPNSPHFEQLGCRVFSSPPSPLPTPDLSACLCVPHGRLCATPDVYSAGGPIW